MDSTARRSTRAAVLAPLLAAAMAAAGCDPPAGPSPLLIGVMVAGNTLLSSVGQTSQLSATATYSDRTTRDVTRQVEWRSSNVAVITVSTAGLVTVVGFGVAGVQATYASTVSNLQVQAWPPGTVAVSGRVREPGQSGLEGVQVLDPQSGRSTQSQRDGQFFLGGVAGAYVTFEKSGYEAARQDVGSSQSVDVAMQRVVRIMAGETVSPLPLAPHDVSYLVGADECFPCRRVRIVAPRAGTLRLTLTWTEPRGALNMWMAGRLFPGTHPELTFETPVDAGEVVSYVGLRLSTPAAAPTYYVPFTLSAAIR